MRNALGGAISAWSGVEGNLCELFTEAVTARNRPCASAAFMAILGFETQLDVVNAAMKEAYKERPDVITVWKKLFDHTNNLRPYRNRLAHGQILRTVVLGGPESVDFLPFHHFGTHKSQIEYDHWSVSDLNALERSFKLLRDVLCLFHRALFGDDPLPEIQLEPIPQVGRPGFGRRRTSQPHPSEDQSQTKRKRPPRSSPA
jgi:hypothetical protein